MRFCVAKKVKEERNVFGICVDGIFYAWKDIAKQWECNENYNDLLDLMTDSEELKKVPVKNVDPRMLHNGVEASTLTFLPPIKKTPKNIICIGKNYREHAIEMGSEADIPENIMVFTKAATSMIGHQQLIPNHKEITKQLDYEGELAVVIGKSGRNITKEKALDYIFGYTIINDVTARDLQSKHKQFFIGKSLDGTCPIGPVVVSKDEIKDPQNLTVKTFVNDELRQNGKTSDMIFSIATMIEIISSGMTLEVGDIIATGTPAGVGKGMKPPCFLKSGDTIKIEIEGIGTLENTIE